jgi:hypothetical protein
MSCFGLVTSPIYERILRVQYHAHIHFNPAEKTEHFHPPTHFPLVFLSTSHVAQASSQTPSRAALFHLAATCYSPVKFSSIYRYQALPGELAALSFRISGWLS